MTRNGILKVDEINAVDSFHKKRGSSPKCSVFRLLPHNLIMGIVKVELDRQKAEKENLDYWIELDKWRRVKVTAPNGTISRFRRALISRQEVQPSYYRLVLADVVKLGKHNAQVQKGGVWVDGDRIPQKKLQKSQINRKSKHNYIPAIIRHYASFGSTLTNLTLADSNVMGRRWLKVKLGWGALIDDEQILVSIKVIRLNRLRHLKGLGLSFIHREFDLDTQ